MVDYNPHLPNISKITTTQIPYDLDVCVLLQQKVPRVSRTEAHLKAMFATDQAYPRKGQFPTTCFNVPQQSMQFILVSTFTM